jgi:hypothetical protein
MCAIPTARLGAPPVRDRRELSPTCRASVSISPGARVKPHCWIAAAALAAVVPIALAGALIAKYTPGVSTQAAMSAMIATSDSVSIAP